MFSLLHHLVGYVYCAARPGFFSEVKKMLNILDFHIGIFLNDFWRKGTSHFAHQGLPLRLIRSDVSSFVATVESRCICVS